MKVIKEISQDQMVAELLKGEISSTRFGDRIISELQSLNSPRSIVDSPNIDNEIENKIRTNILSKIRGFGINKDVFESFPKNIKWFVAIIDKRELKSIKYINYDYWVQLSSGTRLPYDAAKNIKRGTEVFNVSNDNFFKTAEYIKNGGVFSKIIVVTDNDKNKLVSLEGHLRLTAYALVPESIPNRLEVILGISPNIDSWGLY